MGGAERRARNGEVLNLIRGELGRTEGLTIGVAGDLEDPLVLDFLRNFYQFSVSLKFVSSNVSLPWKLARDIPCDPKNIFPVINVMTYRSLEEMVPMVDVLFLSAVEEESLAQMEPLLALAKEKIVLVLAQSSSEDRGAFNYSLTRRVRYD